MKSSFNMPHSWLIFFTNVDIILG